MRQRERKRAFKECDYDFGTMDLAISAVRLMIPQLQVLTLSQIKDQLVRESGLSCTCRQSYIRHSVDRAYIQSSEKCSPTII